MSVQKLSSTAKEARIVKAKVSRAQAPAVVKAATGRISTKASVIPAGNASGKRAKKKG